MIRLIYNLLWPLGLIVFLPGYLIKMFRRGNYRDKFGQRLGIYDAHLRARLYWKKSFWLHARSEEHTSELQSHSDIVCRLLLEKTTRYDTKQGRQQHRDESNHSSRKGPVSL